MTADRVALMMVGTIRELVSSFEESAQEHRGELERILTDSVFEATKLGLAATVGKIEEHETNLSHLLAQAKIVAAKIEFEIAVEAREKFKSVLGTLLMHALRSASGGTPMGQMVKGAGLL